MTLEVRPAFHIHTHTVPGSGHIMWWLPGCGPRYMFNPHTGEMWPCDSGANPDDAFSGIQPGDLGQITKRLLQFDGERRKGFATTISSNSNQTHP